MLGGCGVRAVMDYIDSGKRERIGMKTIVQLAGLVLLGMLPLVSGCFTLVAAGGAAYRELASARVLQGREAWAPMAFVDGLLVCRDAEEMVCLDLRVGGRATTEDTESTEGH